LFDAAAGVSPGRRQHPLHARGSAVGPRRDGERRL